MPKIILELTQDTDLEAMTTMAQDISNNYKHIISDIKLSP